MKRNGKKYADSHIRNSCPVLMSEWSGGTGFFYKSEGDIYLVTAKHNIIPENKSLTHPVMQYSPQIQVLLRSTSRKAWEKNRIDIRERRVFFKEYIDAIAIPVDFDPKKYNYEVYNSGDIQSVNKIKSRSGNLLSMGFDEGSLSRWEMEDVDYTDPGEPRMISLSNPRKETKNYYRAIDIHNSGDCRGVSGAPILEKGLVGILVGQRDSNILFTKAGALPEILNSPREIVEESPMEAFVKNVRRSTAGGD